MADANYEEYITSINNKLGEQDYLDRRVNRPKITIPELKQDTHQHSHYFKDVTNLKKVDVYRVIKLFGVDDPCIQHAVKKLLVAGGRGVKDKQKDIQEAIDSLNRFLEMCKEDEDGTK